MDIGGGVLGVGGGVKETVDKFRGNLGEVLRLGTGKDFLKTTFESANVGVEILGEEVGGFGGDVDLAFFGFLTDDGGPHFEIGGLNINS